MTLHESTSGLASGYQLTQVTGAGLAVTSDTSGDLMLSVTSIPSWQLVPASSPVSEEDARSSDQADLAREMVEDTNFRELTERGMADLAQGRYSRIEDVRRRLGEI